ncbi:MAG: histone family protein [archaeon]
MIEHTMTSAPFDRILRNNGADRVSESGAEALRDVIEEIAADLAKEAVAVSRHAGRKTIKKEDIELIMRQH